MARTFAAVTRKPSTSRLMPTTTTIRFMSKASSLKNHAIKMLPKNSLIPKAAMKIDDEGPPKWRHIPVWTPPIAGFDPDEFAEEAKTD